MKFGRWIVQDEHERRGKNTYWLCTCECGTTRFVKSGDLKNGTSKSCGCIAVDKHFVHGGWHSRLYNVWNNMKKRCYNENDISYRYYGKRGIAVCPEWRNSFESFREWAIANGYDETAVRGECTIDRIDVNGNYEPSNCRWVDMKVQSKNKRAKYADEIRELMEVDDG